jgi:NADH-quinone oxidoreductase subunit I/NAD(P)H-quinone oxidoreductase subunit I
MSRCGGCKACARACPLDCFWIDCERNEQGKLRPSRFDIDQLKCMYCGLCVGACPTKCISMTKEWWGSTLKGADGTNFHGQIRHFGLGYYTPEEKAEVERKRLEAAEAKKKAAAAAPPAPPAASSIAPQPAAPPEPKSDNKTF